tara:strand:- start:1674 stop:2168 length:495 start_codon:yes stop_codon:yes gene_type:complete
MKLLIIGHARHGKDTVCDILKETYGFEFRSSSHYMNEHVIFPILSPIHGYQTLEECYEDRVNHRRSWYNLIRNHCGVDPARLARDIISDYDIYCGMRHREEFTASRREGLFDYVVWVDALERLPAESSDSMGLTRDDADMVIDNNGPLEKLPVNIAAFIEELRY